MPTRIRIVHCVALAVVLQLSLCDDIGNLTTTTTKTEPAISEFDSLKNEVNVLDDMPRNSSSVKKQTPTYSTGNELWDNLIRDCLKKPTFSCIQKNVFTFLDTTMAVKDVNLTNKIQFTRNEVHYEIPDEPVDEENEINLEEGRGERFSETHDLSKHL